MYWEILIRSVLPRGLFNAVKSFSFSKIKNKGKGFGDQGIGFGEISFLKIASINNNKYTYIDNLLHFVV